jgi:nucleoside-diphosphate kinase
MGRTLPQPDAPKKGSIRAMYGIDGTRNAVHGSDSPASAVREIEFFFNPRAETYKAHGM